jgi:hypothetical protein
MRGLFSMLLERLKHRTSVEKMDASAEARRQVLQEATQRVDALERRLYVLEGEMPPDAANGDQRCKTLE